MRTIQAYGQSAAVRALLPLLSLGAVVPLFGQTAPTPPPAQSQAPIKLSEFVVNSSKDVGYAATNAIGVTRTNTALIEIPQVVNVVTKEFMEDVGNGMIFDALKYVSGVNDDSNGGDSIIVRGYSQGNKYSDGMRDQETQGLGGSDPFLYERVEVLKGPSSLVYGSHSNGGVINRVRKQPKFERGGLAALTVGNFGQIKAEFDYSAPLSDRLAYRLITSYKQEDLVAGLNDPFADYKRWSISPSLLWRVTGNTQIRLVGEFMHEEHTKSSTWGNNAMLPPFVRGGTTTFGLLPRDFTFSGEQGDNDNDKQGGWLSVETQIKPNWSLRLAGWVSWWDHGVLDILPAGMQANGRLMNRSMRYIANDDHEGSLALDSNLNFEFAGAKHTFLAILQLDRRFNQEFRFNYANPPALDIFAPNYSPVPLNSPVVATNSDGRGEVRAFSAQDHAKFLDDKLQLVAGARYDWYESRTDDLRGAGTIGVTNQDATWTYKYGVIYRPNRGLSLFYNHSETFNPQFGTNPDGRTFDPQSGVIDEVGVKTALREGRITATIAFYNLELRNLLTADPDPTRASAGYRVQTALQTNKGFDADVILNLVDGVELLFGGSHINYRQPDGLQPRNAPKDTAYGFTRFSVRRGALKGLNFGGGYSWQGENYPEAGNLFTLPGYGTIDVFANYPWKNYKFALSVNNAADKWAMARAINRNIILNSQDRLIKLRVACNF